MTNTPKKPTAKQSSLEKAVFDLSVHYNQVRKANPKVHVPLWGKSGLEELNGLILSIERCIKLLPKQSND